MLRYLPVVNVSLVLNLTQRVTQNLLTNLGTGSVPSYSETAQHSGFPITLPSLEACNFTTTMIDCCWIFHELFGFQIELILLPCLSFDPHYYQMSDVWQDVNRGVACLLSGLHTLLLEKTGPVVVLYR